MTTTNKVTTIAKTFFLEAEIFCPKRIKEKLEGYFPLLDNDYLGGSLYLVDKDESFGYHWTFFEIMAPDKKEIYQIKSQIEDMLGVKLLEPN